jgi:signal peptidase II
MPARKRFALILLTLVACVGCDQQTKALATAHLRGHEAQSFFADTVRLDYTENRGGFLGLGDSLPASWRTAIFSVGCTIGIVAVLIYALLAPRLTALHIFALALVCAGGMGNLIDRWMCGYVSDFLNVGLGPIRTGIFNVADATVMAGSVLAYLIYRRRSLPGPAC